jgi:hypothetical protein
LVSDEHAFEAKQQRVYGHRRSVDGVRSFIATAVDFDLYNTTCGSSFAALVSGNRSAFLLDDRTERITDRDR